MRTPSPCVLDLVLLGGGHTHAIVIRNLGVNPVPGVRVTLVSPNSLTAYSGMLPGLVAGHYTLEEAHIDLTRLCRWAGVCFVQTTVSGLDATHRQIHFADRPSIEYDFLSVNTGGQPRLETVPGATEFCVPIKPVNQFYDRWLALQDLARSATTPLDIGVVGAGAGGFEILLAMNYALNVLSRRTVKSTRTVCHRMHWFVRDNVLPGYSNRVRAKALKTCESQGIIMHRGFEVAEVHAEQLISSHGEMVRQDMAVWCTEAMAVNWLVASGLVCDEKGFIQVTDTLQSLSHPEVFAAGDVAVQVNYPRPRAGVFAVRQGPVLAENLRRVVQGKQPDKYKPQKRFLTLLSLGERSAIGHKGSFVFLGPWVWCWKHWIDTKFMRYFHELPDISPMKPRPIPEYLQNELKSANLTEVMRCGGCGAKVSGEVLTSVLDELLVPDHEDLPVGLADRDDVAIMVTAGSLLAQSVDQLRSFIADSWLFGRIAAIHALSDLYAAQCRPKSAMALVTLPLATQDMMRRELMQLMQGVVLELTRANCRLIGGHTSEGQEMTLGLVVNGELSALTDFRNQDCRAGDCLILTKPIGSGVIMAADMRAKTPGPVVDGALASMLQSNAQAVAVIGKCQVRGQTDVTGFGLAGHLLSLLKRSGMHCQLQLDAIPVLTGAMDLFKRGFRSTLHTANVRHVQNDMDIHNLNTQLQGMLSDPQTSGGLLAVVSANDSDYCLQQLHKAGYLHAACIGILLEPVQDSCRITWDLSNKHSIP